MSAQQTSWTQLFYAKQRGQDLLLKQRVQIATTVLCNCMTDGVFTLQWSALYLPLQTSLWRCTNWRHLGYNANVATSISNSVFVTNLLPAIYFCRVSLWGPFIIVQPGPGCTHKGQRSSGQTFSTPLLHPHRAVPTHHIHNNRGSAHKSGFPLITWIRVQICILSVSHR